MEGEGTRAERGSIFKRKKLVLRQPLQSDRADPESDSQPHTQDINVLVINSSHDMAKEITMQLTLAMPGCSITYAPTVAIASWILRKRKIHLIVSSPVLPDGGVKKLNKVLGILDPAPDLVVVGNINLKSAKIFGESGYEFASLRKFSDADQPEEVDSESGLQATIKSLGADIRNDLNNPLQEIVAMVFVAQANGEVANGTDNALQAIGKAAKNMSSYVNGLERKIRSAVGSCLV